jgi:hypothetical protein
VVLVCTAIATVLSTLMSVVDTICCRPSARAPLLMYVEHRSVKCC